MLISVVVPCYNEEQNVQKMYDALKGVFKDLGKYDYELIFIDNFSKDKTIEILKKIAVTDKRLKIIVNARNFGHIRSPYYALQQTSGDAIILMAADFQDPPELIKEFIKKWESGFKVVIGVKSKSKENPIMFFIRGVFYRTIARLSETDQIRNFTGFGLYDKQVINVVKSLREPYPYFRGIISEIGFERSEIEFVQPRREKGKTKNNFYTLYDMAMLGFVNYSKVPLRMAVFIGFGTALFNLLVAVVYFIYKLVFWDRFEVGMAPLVIGLFFFSSVQLFFIGIIGEYVGVIFTQVKDRPLVIEKERINF